MVHVLKSFAFYAFFSSLLLIGENAFGQKDTTQIGEDIMELSLEELMNIEVITSSRTTLQKSDQAPATIITVTAQQIEDRGYMSLFDVLMDLPDIKTDRLNDPRWMNDVSFRGIRGMDKLIIMLDGIRISSPTNEVMPILENYPVHMAKQIEVIFGPASALYGADAFSGVINIITKKRNDADIFNLTASGGIYQKFTGNFLASKKIANDADLTLGGQYFSDKQPDLYRFYPDDYKGIDSLKSRTFNTIHGPIKPKTPVNPDFEFPVRAYAVNAALRVKHFTFSFFRNYAKNSTALTNNPNNNIYNKSVFIEQGVTMGSASYVRDFGKLNSRTIFTMSRYDLFPESNFRNVFTNMEPGYLYGYGKMWKAEQLLTYKIKESLTITGGGTYESFTSLPSQNDYQYPISGKDPKQGVWVNSVYDNNPSGIIVDLVKINYHNTGALLQLQYNLKHYLKFTLGSRYDHNSIYGSAINPRGGIVFSPSSKLTAKLLYGTAFLAPSRHLAYETYGALVSADSGKTYYSDFLNLPNPKLKPQNISTTEFSIKSFITQQLSIGIESYYSTITGLISPMFDIGNTDLYNGYYKSYPVKYIQVNGNLGHQTVYGLTLQMDYYAKMGKHGKLNLNAAFSFVDGTIDLDGNGPIAARNLPGVAPYTFRFGSTVKVKQLSVSPRLIVLGKQRTFNTASVQISDNTKYQELDGYVLFNCNILYNFKNGISAFVTGENLLDQRYRNVNIGAAPETSAIGSAAAELSNGAPQYPLRVCIGVKVTL